MAANQKNTNLFTYTDDNSVAWNLRGPIDSAINAIDGSSPLSAGAPVWLNSPRRRARHVIYYDPSTFRTVRFPVFSQAAFGAIDGTVSLAVSVPGEATAVTYQLSQKVAERQPVAKTSRNLIDHA
jgi:hypothetical protein